MAELLSNIPPEVKTFLRTFLTVILLAFIAQGADVFSVGLDDLRVWLAAGLAGAGPVVLKWLDPSPEAAQYGRTKDPEPVDIAERLGDE